jgi:hypothetical protein
MLKNKIIVIVSLIFVLLIVGFVVLTKNNSNNISTHKPGESVSSYKEIKVEEAGITFSIPKEFVFSKELQMNLTTKKPYAVNFSIQNYKGTISEVKDPYQLYTNYQWDTEPVSEVDFRKSDFYFDPKTRKEFRVDGRIAISGTTKEQRARYTTYILNKGHIVMFAESKTTDSQREITDKIIKSIKFD